MASYSLFIQSNTMLLLAVSLAFLQVIQGSTVSDCPTGPRTPISVEISGCKAPPCNLVKDTVLNVTIDFEVGMDIQDVQIRVKAYALNIWTSYPMPDPDVCHWLTNGECPLDAGEEVTYLLQMPILTAFPSISILVEMSLVNEKNEVLCCFRVPANVVDP